MNFQSIGLLFLSFSLGQVVSISASLRQQGINSVPALKFNSRGVYGCCKTIIISCDSALPNCQKGDACRDLGVKGLYREAPYTCDFKHDIFRMVEKQNSPAMEINIGTEFDGDLDGFWMVQPESRYCNEFPWVLRSTERNDLCPTDVKEWEVAAMNSSVSVVNITHIPEAACISVKCHYRSTTTTTTTKPTTTSTTTTSSQEDDTSCSCSSPFWQFLLAGLAGAGSVVVLWKICQSRSKTIGGRGRQSDLPMLHRSHSGWIHPSTGASNSSALADSDEPGFLPLGGTDQGSVGGSPPTYEKALHM